MTLKKIINLIFKNKNLTIKDALKVIDKSQNKVIFFQNKKKQLISSLTDGDIRRSIIGGKSILDDAFSISNQNPIYIKITDKKKIKTQNLLKRFKDYFIPIVDHNKRVIDVIKPIHAKKNLNYCDVLILAGGFGKRLLPITSEKPKPLISLNKNTTILGQIIDSLQSQRFLNLMFYILSCIKLLNILMIIISE